MRLEAAGQHPFHGEIQPRAVSKQAIVMLFGQGIHGSRGCAEVARMDRGEARLIHRDKEVFLRRGHVFLIDTRRRFALTAGPPWSAGTMGCRGNMN
jgi:hypothetical protein